MKINVAQIFFEICSSLSHTSKENFQKGLVLFFKSMMIMVVFKEEDGRSHGGNGNRSGGG